MPFQVANALEKICPNEKYSENKIGLVLKINLQITLHRDTYCLPSRSQLISQYNILGHIVHPYTERIQRAMKIHQYTGQTTH